LAASLAVQADDEQVDVDAALDRGGPGVVDHGRAGSHDPAVLHLVWQASQQVLSRIISARCVTPVSCQSLIPRLKVTMRQVWTAGSAGAAALSPSRMPAASRRRLDNRDPQEDHGRAAS